MIEHLYYILKLMRPRQWSKNTALFAAPVFSGQLFDISVMFQVFLGFLAFCLLSSTTYIVNDILDVDKDKLHPFKRARPIASGKISKTEALVIWVILLVVSLLLSYSINTVFFIVTVIYILLQILYSYVFKALAIFDIALIASGYILRIFAGEVISGYHIRVWLFLTTISLALFLAVAKRRSELTLLKNFSRTKIEEVRKSLTHYSENLLDAYSTMFATATLIFYSIFTYYEPVSKPSLSILLPDYLSSDWTRKWLMITIIPVVYGLMRYLQDIYEKNEGESPERVILADKPLLTAVLIWGLLVVFIINVL